MTKRNSSSVRIYVDAPLSLGIMAQCDSERSHYLKNVMRLKDGDIISAFNGVSGEWQAQIKINGKNVSLEIGDRIKQYSAPFNLALCFAFLKGDKNELIIQKATELGAIRITGFQARHSISKSLNMDRARSIAIEAAEQCERLDVPRISTEASLKEALSPLKGHYNILYCDESGKGSPIKDVATILSPGAGVAVVIGPEGGFAAEEFALLENEAAKGMTLGPRILRAETAVIAALSCIQALAGDWSEKPSFRSLS